MCVESCEKHHWCGVIDWSRHPRIYWSPDLSAVLPALPSTWVAMHSYPQPVHLLRLGLSLENQVLLGFRVLQLS